MKFLGQSSAFVLRVLLLGAILLGSSSAWRRSHRSSSKGISSLNDLCRSRSSPSPRRTSSLLVSRKRDVEFSSKHNHERRRPDVDGEIRTSRAGFGLPQPERLGNGDDAAAMYGQRIAEMAFSNAAVAAGCPHYCGPSTLLLRHQGPPSKCSAHKGRRTTASATLKVEENEGLHPCTKRCETVKTDQPRHKFWNSGRTITEFAFSQASVMAGCPHVCGMSSSVPSSSVWWR